MEKEKELKRKLLIICKSRIRELKDELKLKKYNDYSDFETAESQGFAEGGKTAYEEIENELKTFK